MFEFGKSTENVDINVKQMMIKDGLKRHLNWCTDTEDSICHSSLGEELIIESNDKNEIIANIYKIKDAFMKICGLIYLMI